jgi:hypothetical protein
MIILLRGMIIMLQGVGPTWLDVLTLGRLGLDYTVIFESAVTDNM